MEVRQTLQSVQPFRTQDEYLYAMKEDLAEWFNGLYDLDIGVNDFFQQLENGVVICRHANNVHHHMLQQLGLGDASSGGGEVSPVEFQRGSSAGFSGEGVFGIYYRTNVRPGTFQSRDNISNFIAWCRNTLRIPDTLLFETDDLVLRKNERNVILCLLEVARRGSKFGLPVPVLVQLEQEIDAEIAAEAGGATIFHGQVNQSLKKRTLIKVDMKSLDELVRDVLGRCTCPDQFPMIKVSDGKYRIGDSLTMIFLRILRSHVMVRIGGGWDTLENYLNRHDPCRCQYKTGHGLLNTGIVTVTKEDATSMPQQPSEDISKRTPERSKNLTTSFNRRLPVFDVTDSSPPGGGSQGTRSDGATKRTPSKANLGQLNPPHDSNRRSLSPMTPKSCQSRRADVVQNDVGGTGSSPDLGIGTSNRSRRSSVDSPFHRRTQSTEHQPRAIEQTPPRRPASTASRARSVGPLGPGLCCTHLRSTSCSRERPAKDTDLLMIARDKEGKHRVKDTPRNQILKTGSAEGVENLSTKEPQQQQSRVKTSRMQINAKKLLPSKTSPVHSTSKSLQNKTDMERPGIEGSSNHELRQTATFDWTPVMMSPDDNRTTDGIAESCSSSSPTKPDLLIEEYRKIGLGIQDLIKNAEDMDNTRCLGDRKLNIDSDDMNLSHNLDARPFPNDASAVSPRNARMIKQLPSANASECVSRELQSGDQTKGLDRSSPVLKDTINTGSPQPTFVTVDQDSGPSKTVETSRRTLEAADRRAPRTRSCSREPGKETSLPRSSRSTRNQRASSCAGRTRGRAVDENGESDASRRTIADFCPNPRRIGYESEKRSGQHRTKTTSAQNWNKEPSKGSGELNSAATPQNTPLRKPCAMNNLHCSSMEIMSPDVSLRHSVDDIEQNVSTILDDYCRKALTRKDVVQGEKRASRIPMPVEVRERLELNKHPRGYGQLKRADSGVDINNISPR